jgi:hypothetical protein
MKRSTYAALVSAVLVSSCFIAWNTTFYSVELVGLRNDETSTRTITGQQPNPAYVTQIKNLFSGLRRTEYLHQSLRKIVDRLNKYRQNIALPNSWRQALSDHEVDIEYI